VLAKLRSQILAAYIRITCHEDYPTRKMLEMLA